MCDPSDDTLAQAEERRRLVDSAHGQIEELMTGYGPVDIRWLDGSHIDSQLAVLPVSNAIIWPHLPSRPKLPFSFQVRFF